jgi:hypothetical protein
VGQKAKRKGKAFDNAYKAYKAEGRASKNKLKKVRKHCKENPNDKYNAENLERIVNNGSKYTRDNRKVPGSNKPSFSRIKGFSSDGIYAIKTFGEQYRVLLGIPEPVATKKGRPKIKVKSRKHLNVGTDRILEVM